MDKNELFLRIKQLVDAGLIAEGGGNSLNSVNVSVNFLLALDSTGRWFGYATKRKVLVSWHGDVLAINFGEFLVEIDKSELIKILSILGRNNIGVAGALSDKSSAGADACEVPAVDGDESAGSSVTNRGIACLPSGRKMQMCKRNGYNLVSKSRFKKGRRVCINV
jgi:hypothetical protein